MNNAYTYKWLNGVLTDTIPSSIIQVEAVETFTFEGVLCADTPPVLAQLVEVRADVLPHGLGVPAQPTICVYNGKEALYIKTSLKSFKYCHWFLGSTRADRTRVARSIKWRCLLFFVCAEEARGTEKDISIPTTWHFTALTCIDCEKCVWAAIGLHSPQRIHSKSQL
jgi:hypothetical protein